VKLGVNGWRIHGQRTGIGRYLSNVVTRWTPDAVAGRFEEVNFYTPRPLDPADVPLPGPVRERVLRPEWRMLAWENARMAPVADDDVLFCPSYSRPLFARGRTVVTTHDATMHIHPELYPRSGRLFYDRLYGWSARHATLVITTTKTVRDDVARCYGVSPARIRVVNLAVDEHIRPLPGDPRVDEARRRYLGVDAPFFYFVGKLSARRNVPKLIEAFAEFKRNHSLDHKLLVVGLNTTGVDVDGLAAKFGVSEHVVHHEYIAEDDLVLLYNAADAFIMPSTFETLSLPVMESQAVGTPVISIDTPGVRETTGGTAYLMPKAEISEMVKAMAALARDESLRTELSAAGLEQAARLSWGRCSAETLAVLEEAAALDLRDSEQMEAAAL
jgi:glycosyltransferase involved in cell wall biosynthesis